MNNHNLNNNNEIKIETKITWQQFIKRGYIQIRYNLFKTILFIIATGILSYVIYNFESWKIGIDFVDSNKIVTAFNEIFEINIPINIFLPVLAGVFYVLFILALAIPIGNKKYEENCLKAGIVNYLKQTPIFIRKYKNKFNKKNTIIEFYTNATSFEKQWEKLRAELDNAFEDDFINGMRKKKNNRKIIQLNLSEEETDYSKSVYLDTKHDTKISDNKEFKIPLGINDFYEPVYWDLVETPHALIGGQTRRGKTVTEKLIKSYCLKNNCEVWSFDFKGGVDFNNPIWKEKGLQQHTTICALIIKLEEAVTTLENRIEIFNTYKVSNFEKYKSKYPNSDMKRILIVFDEAAEFLDKDRYITKEDKEMYNRIINALSTLGGRGAGFALHLCTITQSPSADIIPKFLRRNSGFRISFEADSILSEIILDNQDAHEKIPKGIKGLCVTNRGELVKCYYVENDEDYFK